MKIGIIGLGIIGGSFAKAIKKKTPHQVGGLDTNPEAVRKALEQEAIDFTLDCTTLHEMDLVIICLYPQATMDFLLENKARFRKGAVVMDTCGIKSAVVTAVSEPLKQAGVRFVGCHPMAGREFSGFDYAVDNLFDGASFIITPTEETELEARNEVQALALSLGFLKCVEATPAEHDRIIAYTSQLAHIVSSAYIKNPSVLRQAGFSAGSFKDMTRVARLNETMWTSLFLMNRESLLSELDCLIASLEEYRDALADGDAPVLKELLREGREKKELSDRLLAQMKESCTKSDLQEK